jgi:hypothetical protein
LRKSGIFLDAWLGPPVVLGSALTRREMMTGVGIAGEIEVNDANTKTEA